MFGRNQNPAEKHLRFYQRTNFKNFFKFGFPVTIMIGATFGVMIINYQRNQTNMSGQFYYHQSLVQTKMEVGAEKYRCIYQDDKENSNLNSNSNSNSIQATQLT